MCYYHFRVLQEVTNTSLNRKHILPVKLIYSVIDVRGIYRFDTQTRFELNAFAFVKLGSHPTDVYTPTFTIR